MTTALKWPLIGVAGMAITLLSACGGGESPAITTYQVSAMAGTGGTISPASATVDAGGTTTLAVTANSGYAVSSVTGCGGTLTGNAYITGTINASCTVTASFAAAFTWVSGSNSPDATAVYGTQGVAAASNVPGARHGPVTWTDASGNLWLFGGYGLFAPPFTDVPMYNDVWKYSPTSGQWTWIGGPNTANGPGIFGTQGTPAAPNTPGAVGSSAFTWTDANGNLWLFGGYGNDSTGNRGWLNALWEYSPTTGMWTWNGGSTIRDALGSYGTKGVTAATNFPPARAIGGWKDSNGNVWLFGGYGYDSTGALGRLNDLWEYSPATGMWTWVGGPNTVNGAGVYGVQGVAAATNLPGARTGGPTWMDASGNVWVFGGYGYDSTGAQGSLNDLWEYSPATGMWTWVGGSDTVNTKGVYSAQGVAAATNVPGARWGPTAWTDAAGNVWLFGGTGYDSAGTYNMLNDLWKFSPSSRQWTWVDGSNTVNAVGVYGIQGAAATTNMPGARGNTAIWTGVGGNVWLFGGEGFDPNANPNAPQWNDLWTYPIE